MQRNKIKENIERIVSDVGIKTSRYWKNLLYNIPEHEIGVIKVSGDVISTKNLKQLSAEIGYLGRCFPKNDGFYLPLIIGGGKYYSKITGKTKKVNGYKVISSELIEKIIDDAKENSLNVSKELKKAGIKSVILPLDTIKVIPHGEETDDNGKNYDTEFLGDIINIDTKPIIEVIYQNKIPIITAIGKYNNNFYKVDGDDLATELAKTLKAKKLIIIGQTPFVDKDGEIVSEINSEFEFKKMIQKGKIRKSLIKKGLDAYELLDYMGPGNSVQITSLKYKKGQIKSTGLIEELLGNGNGTKISTPFIITSYPLKVVEKKMLKKLINDIFHPQRKRIVKDYFKRISKKSPTVYLATKNAGGAISYAIDECEYICKMFTHKDYEGIGIGTSIIDTIYLQKGPVSWRTNIKNEGAIIFYDKIEAHYKDQGIPTDSEKVGQYKVYSIGLEKNKSEKAAKKIAEIESTITSF